MPPPTVPAPASGQHPAEPDSLEASPPPPQPPPPEPRQRWQVTYRRDPVSSDRVGRAAIEAWQAVLAGCGLPLAQLDAAGRPRIAFGAPLAAAAEGEAELAEFWLAERVPLWRLRAAIAERLPDGHAFVSAEDIWLGAPPLAGRVVAADWCVGVQSEGVELATLVAAAERLLAARSLPRIRSKGGTDMSYDLRPLLLDVRLMAAASGSSLAVGVRTRFHPELGSGRPEEVVAALAEAAGVALGIVAITRKRLLLAEDLAPDERAADRQPTASIVRPGPPRRPRPR